LHAWQVRVLFGMWEKHELIGLNTISSCFSHILKRTCRTCHACNGPHPKYLIEVPALDVIVIRNLEVMAEAS